MCGVVEGRESYHRGAVLVVVEDRDVQFVYEAFLDLEAAGSGNVLKVDAAEDQRNVFYGRDEFLDVLGVDADGEGVNVAEGFEEDGFSLHDGKSR